jgi:hypothetical protein
MVISSKEAPPMYVVLNPAAAPNRVRLNDKGCMRDSSRLAAARTRRCCAQGAAEYRVRLTSACNGACRATLVWLFQFLAPRPLMRDVRRLLQLMDIANLYARHFHTSSQSDRYYIAYA